MARSINDSLSLLETSLGDITTSLGNKGVTAENLKASQVPDKIRDIEVSKYPPIPTGIFGIKIIETEEDPYNRVVYTDRSLEREPVVLEDETGIVDYHGWDKTWIFDKIYPVMLKTDGTIDYKLNPNDYNQKLEGGSSDVNNVNYDGNAMVCIEKFYTKFSMDGQDELIEVCNQKEEGFEAIGFIREDGSEADKIFLPMFSGFIDENGNLRSIGGQTIKYNTSFTDSRTAAQRNGTGYDIEYWAGNQIMQALFFILMKSCNPKTAIGAGRNYDDGSSKTGLMNNKGAIACDPTTKAVKFMHIEDFTSNYNNGMLRWEAGALVSSGKLFVKMKPPYSGTATSGYTQVSDYVQGSKYISRMKCSNNYGRCPIAYRGSNSTYEVAYWFGNTNSDIRVSMRGYNFGVAGRRINYGASFTADIIGAALSFLPPA